jgi:DNA invertase Pin-like site-specific DNA recombinase
MNTIGYARVSSIGQSLDVQLEKLSQAGCEKVFADNRSELQSLLSWVRSGDSVVVTKMNRLARSTSELWFGGTRIQDIYSNGI